MKLPDNWNPEPISPEEDFKKRIKECHDNLKKNGQITTRPYSRLQGNDKRKH